MREFNVNLRIYNVHCKPNKLSTIHAKRLQKPQQKYR